VRTRLSVHPFWRASRRLPSSARCDVVTAAAASAREVVRGVRERERERERERGAVVGVLFRFPVGIEF